MIQKLVLISILVIIGFNLNGQVIIEGSVKDSKSMEGLAYVNIGIVGANVGTVTDLNGKFHITLDEKYDNNELQISMIGYKSKLFKVADFKQLMLNATEVTLDEAPYEMEAVIVYGNKFKKPNTKKNTLGNKNKSKNYAAGFETNLLGNEMGIVIKTKRRPVFIKDFNIQIASNDYETFKFRINFYSLKNGLPDQNLLKENIIVASSIKKGKLTVDLSKYNLIMEDDFFVSMEWIEDMGKHGLFFYTDVSETASPTITRKTSQGEWKEINKLTSTRGLGITLTVQY
ncbi:carboxypeptidase-like regulatory domain-containing protein [Fulvivirga lutimaris]|uniref:carboxypeptidase-like regulatory domain-containing protein n=1 Tax=Fulvivirga lutimaris TaxID=1819566 RepID=UPI0012BD51A2|nr:carboxypeptidase-like regulatory domain-containing protein [Fulvivirga lutimaris]MTI39411.1 carboxypeptidase-like regulatory domain-containing protein [Fulvivirga lutimaris]